MVLPWFRIAKSYILGSRSATLISWLAQWSASPWSGGLRGGFQILTPSAPDPHPLCCEYASTPHAQNLAPKTRLLHPHNRAAL